MGLGFTRYYLLCPSRAVTSLQLERKLWRLLPGGQKSSRAEYAECELILMA